MITISDALTSIRKNTPLSPVKITLDLKDAMGHVLSESILSPISMPPFRQSAMDGYALNLHDTDQYELLGELKAGDSAQATLKPGQALRIFTGAMVPNSANAIAIQEKVLVNGNVITLEGPIREGANIRPLGEQVRQGAIALQQSTILNSAGVGFLASLGVTEVSVYKKPSIAIVVTGNELTPPGQALESGKIYESNGIMLQNVLKSLGYSLITKYTINDDYLDTLQTLGEAIEANDFTIITGGISVGDYDFVGKALPEIGVEEHFYKVHQKPGKPLFYGSNGNKQVFALPGNPAATLSCFYLYVLLSLEIYSGNNQFQLHRTMARSQGRFEAKGNRPQFLKARYSDGKVSILEGQNSSMLHTFALANALVFKPETTSTINKDDLLETILLP